MRKLLKILQIWISRAGLEVLGDPSGAKMAQDASCISYGAEVGDVLGLILSPRWPKLSQNDARMVLCWPTWTPRANLTPFWEPKNEFLHVS